MVNSQEHSVPSFDSSANKARATPIAMSATTYNLSPVTPHNAQNGGLNITANTNTSATASMNTTAAHSVYPMSTQTPAPTTNASQSFATSHDVHSSPMNTESAMTAPGYYGAQQSHRNYQAAMYQQQQQQHLQQHHQQQYADQSSQGISHQQGYHDGGYSTAVVPYHQQGGAIQPYASNTEPYASNAGGYGHTRSDSMQSWQSSDNYDYGSRHGSVSGGTGSRSGGGKHKGEDEPILLPGEEPAARPARSYQALIAEALLMSPPPHHLYVSEIADSIKARYACE